jgi:CheY-like chemotaxis protein
MAERHRVMVVDDTDHVRRMLRSMLELDGFDVVADVASGGEAVATVEAALPDVVVIDYMMPDMDGLATAGALRPLLPDAVLILYTAFLDGDVQRRAAEIGVDLCVAKVEGLETLEREITRLAGSSL